MILSEDDEDDDDARMQRCKDATMQKQRCNEMMMMMMMMLLMMMIIIIIIIINNNIEPMPVHHWIPSSKVRFIPQQLHQRLDSSSMCHSNLTHAHCTGCLGTLMTLQHYHTATCILKMNRFTEHFATLNNFDAMTSANSPIWSRLVKRRLVVSIICR